MAKLKNLKNNKIIKDIKDENLVSIYLGTKEWEKVEEKKSTFSIPKQEDKEVK